MVNPSLLLIHHMQIFLNKNKAVLKLGTRYRSKLTTRTFLFDFTGKISITDSLEGFLMTKEGENKKFVLKYNFVWTIVTSIS